MTDPSDEPTATVPPAIRDWIRHDLEQDFDGMRAQLASDVRLISPLTDAFTFDGPDEVMAVYRSVLPMLRDISIAPPTGRGQEWVLHGTNTLGGRNLEEIQWMHLNEAGRIDQITLFIRPVSAALSVLAKVGPPLARRKVLRPTARVASVLAVPVAAAIRLTERRLMPLLKR